MTQKTIIRILLVYWSITLAAVVLRIDRFPITWAPMYSIYKSKTPAKSNKPKTLSVDRIDKKRLKTHGFLATRRNGEQRWVNQKDLNVRNSSMRRMYHRRMKGRGPPTYGHRNHDAGTIDRWLWGLEPGEYFTTIDWKRRLIVSINKTLGLDPASPDFIVQLEASWEANQFDAETRQPLGVKTVSRVVDWDDAWNAEY